MNRISRGGGGRSGAGRMKPVLFGNDTAAQDEKDLYKRTDSGICDPPDLCPSMKQLVAAEGPIHMQRTVAVETPLL